VLVGSWSAPADEAERGAAPVPMVEQELEAIKKELAALRQLLERGTTEGSGT
jgi:hypothetical protein